MTNSPFLSWSLFYFSLLITILRSLLYSLFLSKSTIFSLDLFAMLIRLNHFQLNVSSLHPLQTWSFHLSALIVLPLLQPSIKTLPWKSFFVCDDSHYSYSEGVFPGFNARGAVQKTQHRKSLFCVPSFWTLTRDWLCTLEKWTNVDVKNSK